MTPEAALREQIRRSFGEAAAFEFDAVLIAGLPCELCGSGGATLCYPEKVALCSRCHGEGGQHEPS